MSKYRAFDLEERLIDFAVRVIRTADSRYQNQKSGLISPVSFFEVVLYLHQITERRRVQNHELILFIS